VKDELVTLKKQQMCHKNNTKTKTSMSKKTKNLICTAQSFRDFPQKTRLKITLDCLQNR